MDGGVSFGAGKAGQTFDPVGFIIRPQVILKFLSCVCSFILLYDLHNRH